MTHSSLQSPADLESMLSDATSALTADEVSSARNSLEEVAAMYGDRDMAVQQNMITHTSEEDLY